MASRKTTTDQLDLFAVAPVQTAPTKLVETPQPILDTRDLVLSQEQVEPNVSTASDDVVPQEQLVEVPSADDVVVARDPTTLPTGDDERSVWLCFFSVGGVVLAIVSGSIESRTDVRSVQLRRIIETHGGRIEIIPNGGFAESGTMIKTAMLMFNVCAHCRTTCSVLK